MTRSRKNTRIGEKYVAERWNAVRCYRAAQLCARFVSLERAVRNALGETFVHEGSSAEVFLV